MFETTCPFCNSEQTPDQCVLGTWGAVYACRCRYCGAPFTIDINEVETDE